MSEPTPHHLTCPDAHGGHRMAYWQWGPASAGHVVLCVHGLSRQGRDFDTLARALLARAAPGTLRVVCPDLAGRGQSDWLKDPAGYQVPAYAADMLALIQQLQPATLDWVGTSLGGLIGLVICGQAAVSAAGPTQGVKAPSGGSAAHEVASVGAINVRRLVLNDVGPTLQWQAMQRIGAYLGQPARFETVEQAADALLALSPGFGPHTREQWLALTRPMLKPAVDGSGFVLHYDPAIAIPFTAITPEAAARSEATLWRLYDQIRADTLLLRGAESDLLSPATAQAMTQRGPRARLVEFAGVGHAPTFVADDQVRVVCDFLLE
jgi:pimeloyl-ACP methyl ester carboxylesterase